MKVLLLYQDQVKGCVVAEQLTEAGFTVSMPETVTFALLMQARGVDAVLLDSLDAPPGSQCPKLNLFSNNLVNRGCYAAGA